MNEDIGKERIRNEWSIRMVSNKFCIFLENWSLGEEIFPTCYRSCVYVRDFLMLHLGVFPVLLETILDRLDLYERNEMEDCQ